MSNARVVRTLKFAPGIALYIALATVALAAPKVTPGDDDDDLTSGETLTVGRPPSPRSSATPIKKTMTVSGASRAAKTNANVSTGAGSNAKGNSPNNQKSTVSAKAQPKPPTKTSQAVQEIKGNEAKSRTGSGDSKTNSGAERKKKKEKSR